MPIVTVPGVTFDPPQAIPGVTTTAISLPFQSAASQQLAVQLLGSVYAAFGAGGLTIADDNTTGTPSGAGTIPAANPAATPQVKEYVLGDNLGFQDSEFNPFGFPQPTSGTVPAGFTAVIDAFTNRTSTITGSGDTNESVVAGGQMEFLTKGGSGTYIAGQGGNTIVGDPGDKGWTIRFDGGANTVFAGGGGYFITTGDQGALSSSLIFLNASGDDTVISWGNDSIIAAPGGTADVATFTSGAIFWSSTGSSTYTNLGGQDTFVAGGGSDTVYAAASGGTYFGNSGPLLFLSGTGASSTVVTGTGNATIFGASGSPNQVFLGPGHDVIVGGPSALQLVVGGVTSGAATIFGNDGGTVSLFSPVNGNTLVAGPGNVTLNGAGATGNDVYFAGPGSGSADSIVAGSGNNTLVAGPGSNTLVGGTGADVFSVDKTFASGGASSIFGWNGNDRVELFHYGFADSATGLPAGATVSVVNGSEVLTLADGTKITFVGFSSIPNSHILSG